MHFFLGCDVSKAKLDCCLINAQGQEVQTAIVPNDTTAITTYLLNTVGQLLSFDDELTVTVEATSIYHLTLCESAYVLGIPCMVYNPILTKQQLRSSIRSKKTDKTDALLIARIGLRGEGKAYTQDAYPLTKQYVRSYQKLSVLSSAFTLHAKHLDSQIDDGLPEAVQASFTAIQTSLDAAKQQLKLQLATSAESKPFHRLQTIPGIGPFVAASILGEIQDMTRFPTSKALIAYTGLDPRIRQSGTSLNRTGRLTKRGSSYLRRNIFIAAHVARRYDPAFQELYDKKRAEGKPYTVATIVVARKLLAVVRAVWLSGEDYSRERYTKLLVTNTGEKGEKA